MRSLYSLAPIALALSIPMCAQQNHPDKDKPAAPGVEPNAVMQTVPPLRFTKPNGKGILKRNGNKSS